jgi:hypothetical protein
MKDRLSSATLFVIGLALIAAPIIGAAATAPPAACGCSGSLGTPGTICGQCDTGPIKLKIGCAVCCEGTSCSQTDGPGTD